jgi:hypothetical protein
MITRLEEIPSLTQSWLAPLHREDPALYGELAESLVIERASHVPGGWSPPDPSFAIVISVLQIIGKEVGALAFPQEPVAAPIAALEGFDRTIRASFEIDGAMMFVADYGQDLVFVTSGDTGLLQREGDAIAAIPLARNFAAFLIGQCNAYDSYKRHIVSASNVDAYFAEAEAIAASGELQDADIAMIYTRQLEA